MFVAVRPPGWTLKLTFVYIVILQICTHTHKQHSTQHSSVLLHNGTDYCWLTHVHTNGDKSSMQSLIVYQVILILLADKFCAGKWASFLNWSRKLLFIFVHVVVPLCSCYNNVLFIAAGCLDGISFMCAPDHLCAPVDMQMRVSQLWRTLAWSVANPFYLHQDRTLLMFPL